MLDKGVEEFVCFGKSQINLMKSWHLIATSSKVKINVLSGSVYRLFKIILTVFIIQQLEPLNVTTAHPTVKLMFLFADIVHKALIFSPS